MENVTDRTSNPFAMRPPCRVSPDASIAFGYGDANADFHVVGDRPEVHGGRTTGVPFTECAAGREIQRLLYETGFAAEPYSDAPDLSNCFLSYIHMCPSPDDETPSRASYDRLERFFDAEFRAINAHVLLAVGRRATDHVLRHYTARAHKLDLDMGRLHARDVRGRGVLVVPIEEPTAWDADDRTAIVEAVRSIRNSDYRQTKGVATTVG